MKYSKNTHDIVVFKSIYLTDNRGYLLKPFMKEVKIKFDFTVDEVFLSSSKKDVIRGMHLQKNPNELKKIITCIKGEVLDVCVNVDKNSKNFGDIKSFLLSEENNNSIYVPNGYAHGFKVLSKEATLLYLQDGNYSQKDEIGINPLTLGFDWGIKKPVISKRDLNLTNYIEFIESIK